MVENRKLPLPRRPGWIEGLDLKGKIRPALSLPLPLGVAHSYSFGGEQNCSEELINIVGVDELIGPSL